MISHRVVITLMAASGVAQHTVRVTLKGYDNDTYHGTLILRNLSALLGGHLGGGSKVTEPGNMTHPIPGSPGHPEDPSGASYYVIAVVLVYGMSIVMLIASHIKRKHAKLIEDRQIHKYLQEFQIVKEKSSRDSYKSLKTSIMAKLNMPHRNPTYKTLSHAILPMIAVGLPASVGKEGSSSDTDSLRSTITTRRASLQTGHASFGSKSRARRASEFDINWKQITAISGRMFRRGSSEDSNDSRWGRRSRTNSHTMPSTIEEDSPTPPPLPPPGKEMSTVIEMSDDDTPKTADEHTRDVSPQRSGLSSPAKSESGPNERYYYKPISISRACRVYEIPRDAKSELIKPGGVHVAIHRPVVTSPTRPTATRATGADSSTAGHRSGFINGLHSRANHPHNDVALFSRSRHVDGSHVEVTIPEESEVIVGGAITSDRQGTDGRANHTVSTANGLKDKSVQIPASFTTVPALIHTAPKTDHVSGPGGPHSIRPKLIDRRVARQINGDQPHPVATDSYIPEDNIQIKTFQEPPVQDQRLSSLQDGHSDRKSLHIDVSAGSQHQDVPVPDGRASPPLDHNKSYPAHGGHPDNVRRSSWSPSGQKRSKRRDQPRKPLSSLSSHDSPTPKGTPEARDRVRQRLVRIRVAVLRNVVGIRGCVDGDAPESGDAARRG